MVMSDLYSSLTMFNYVKLHLTLLPLRLGLVVDLSIIPTNLAVWAHVYPAVWRMRAVRLLCLGGERLGDAILLGDNSICESPKGGRWMRPDTPRQVVIGGSQVETQTIAPSIDSLPD